MTDSICDLCKAIPPDLFNFEGDDYEYKEYKHAPSYEHLKKSAQNGCKPCSIFVQALGTRSGNETPITLFNLPAGSLIKKKIMPEYPTTNGDVYIRRGPVSEMVISGLIDFGSVELNWLIQPGTPQQRTVGSVPYLNPDPGCHQNIELITNLIKTCLSGHPSCHTQKQSSLPTRVLDLGDDPNATTVRVVPGSHCAERRGRYMTLSHCWGNPPADVPWKLTTERMEKFVSEVPFDIIPKTFREAIDLVKRIGERYLWIDSLCIIQDSNEDWELEASRMAGVYGGSLCTISTATNDTDSGCYLPREVTSMRPFEWKLSQTGLYGNSTDTTVILYPIFGDVKDPDPDPPVFGRAWCLQERELSHRLIQFDSEGWIWKCSKTVITERKLYSETFDYCGKPRPRRVLTRGVNDVPRVPADTHVIHDPTLVRFASPNFPQTVAWNNRKQANDYWREIMVISSRTKITNPSDRIPALHGLVTRQASAFPDTYAYGTWESDMIPELVWRCSFKHDNMGINTRPEPMLAPTWSWLSVQSPIYFVKSMQIPEARTYARFEDSDGKTMPMTIRGRGCLIEMKCQEYEKDQVDQYQKHGRYVHFFGGSVMYDTLEDLKLTSCFHCLPLQRIGCTERDGSRNVRGLALTRVPWEKDGISTFRRVGLYGGSISGKHKVQEFRII